MFNNPTRSFSQRLRLAGRNLVWAAFWLTGLSLILLHPLLWLFAGSLKLLRMVSYFTPWLLLLSLPMLIVAGLGHRKWLVWILGFATLAISLPFAPLFLPNRQAVPAPGDFPLKIMSYNQLGIQEISGIVEVIRQEKPDILLIQEYAPALVSSSFHGLDDLYPELYIDADSKGFGQAVMSRYPLKPISAELEKGRTQKVVIETPVGSIAVWNVHPAPPFLVPAEEYDEQVSALAADISRAKGPLIVGGDLNATSQSEAYRRVTRSLADAHWEAGWGFSFSYPAPPHALITTRLQTGPLWRIDYIFHSQDFIVTNARTLKISGGSDHFPVVAELFLVK